MFYSRTKGYSWKSGEVFHFKRLERRNFLNLMKKRARRLDKIWLETADLLRKKKRVPVDPPEFGGWKRTYRLREDLTRSPRAGMLNEILEKINTIWYSKNKSFDHLTHDCGAWTYVPLDSDYKQS